MLSRNDMIREGIGLAVSGGTALAIGVVHGRKGVMPALGPIPLDAAVAGGATLLGLSGALGKQATGYILEIAKGATSYFSGSLGAQIGQRMRNKSGDQKGETVGSVDAGWWDGTRTITKGVSQPLQQMGPGSASRGVYGAQAVNAYAAGRGY